MHSHMGIFFILCLSIPPRPEPRKRGPKAQRAQGGLIQARGSLIQAQGVLIQAQGDLIQALGGSSQALGGQS